MAKARSKTLEWNASEDAEGAGLDDEPSPIEEALEEAAVVAEPAVARVDEAPTPPVRRPVTEPAAPAQPPTAPVAVVPLEVFRQVSGVKPDQFAGFAWFAKRQGLKAQPVASWRKEYAKFLHRAV